jgi:hypothetical protein
VLPRGRRRGLLTSPLILPKRPLAAGRTPGPVHVCCGHDPGEGPDPLEFHRTVPGNPGRLRCWRFS